MPVGGRGCGALFFAPTATPTADFDPGRQISTEDEGSRPGFESWIVECGALADPIDIGPVELANADIAQAGGISRWLKAPFYGPAMDRDFSRPAASIAQSRKDACTW